MPARCSCCASSRNHCASAKSLVDSKMRTGSPGPCVGAQVLAQALGVAVDQVVGGVQDVAEAAVVLLQLDDLVDLELALEVGHVAHQRAAEAVDALVVVAHREHRAVAGRRTSSARRTAGGWCPGTRRPGCAGSDGGSARAAPRCRASARRRAAAARRSRPRPRAGTGPRRPCRSRPASASGRRGSRRPSARRPSSLAPAMNQLTCLGTKRSSSSCIALMMRLTADSWSAVSRIWKPCGSPASFQCARRKRLHRPWKVPIHMPRTLIGSIAASRACISLDALLVNVTAISAAGRDLPRLQQPGDAGGEHARLARAGAGQDQRRARRQRHGGQLLGVQAAQQPVGRRGFRDRRQNAGYASTYSSFADPARAGFFPRPCARQRSAAGVLASTLALAAAKPLPGVAANCPARASALVEHFIGRRLPRLLEGHAAGRRRRRPWATPNGPWTGSRPRPTTPPMAPGALPEAAERLARLGADLGAQLASAAGGVRRHHRAGAALAAGAASTCIRACRTTATWACRCTRRGVWPAGSTGWIALVELIPVGRARHADPAPPGARAGRPAEAARRRRAPGMPSRRCTACAGPRTRTPTSWWPPPGSRTPTGASRRSPPIAAPTRSNPLLQEPPWKSSTTTTSCCCRASASSTAAASATPRSSSARAASSCRWCRPT